MNKYMFWPGVFCLDHYLINDKSGLLLRFETCVVSVAAWYDFNSQNVMVVSLIKHQLLVEHGAINHR